MQGRNFPDRLVGAMTCLLSLEGPSLEVVDRDDESRTGVMRKRKHSPEGGSGHVDPLSDLYAVLETYPSIIGIQCATKHSRLCGS